jgi:hypothetical protein
MEPRYSVIATTAAGEYVTEMTKHFSEYKSARLYFQGRVAEYSDGTNTLCWRLHYRPVAAKPLETEADMMEAIALHYKSFEEALEKMERPSPDAKVIKDSL